MFTNNPVAIYPAYYDRNTASAKVSFHQIIVNVTASCNGHAVSQEFSSPCPNVGSGTVFFDIHTALMAAAETYPWSPVSLQAPKVSFSCSYREEYLLDGDLRTVEGAGTSGSATVGALTDRERQRGVTDKVTCKPATVSPQIAATDEDVVIGGTLVSEPDIRVYRLSESMSDLADRYVFRFVNHYGCIESIGVTCLRETEMSVSSEQFALSRPETLTDFSRARYSKQNDFETWHLSSGPLDRSWQQWFAHELLMTEHCWLYVDNVWQRVHIVPEESVNLVNRIDQSILEIQFSVRFDINGDPTGLI